MAKLNDVPDFDKDEDIDVIDYIKQAGKRPSEIRTKLVSFRIPIGLLEFIDTESKRLKRPKTKVIKAALLAYKKLNNNELVNIWYEADRNE
ncbi:hypothetical protein [Arsenophonus nasoniae]|uniref:CopG family transcriptional regulator n=1 Tax=Arsenophonus nasoniae TaxID=638 RepID=A0AA95GQX0_9GAMM|nr:hypothetical protein [Arsenophonus nasoniae]WGM03648.1 hypothetical protein QE210_19705 [Arsenophonus nasoniae]